MFEIIFNKHQDPFPPDTRCLLEDQPIPISKAYVRYPEEKSDQYPKKP